MSGHIDLARHTTMEGRKVTEAHYMYSVMYEVSRSGTILSKNEEFCAGTLEAVGGHCVVSVARYRKGKCRRGQAVLR